MVARDHPHGRARCGARGAPCRAREEGKQEDGCVRSAPRTPWDLRKYRHGECGPRRRHRRRRSLAYPPSLQETQVISFIKYTALPSGRAVFLICIQKGRP